MIRNALERTFYWLRSNCGAPIAVANPPHSEERRVCFCAGSAVFFTAHAAFASDFPVLEPSSHESSVYQTLFSTDRLVVLRNWGEQKGLAPVPPKNLSAEYDLAVTRQHKRFPTAEDSTIASYLVCWQIPALISRKTSIGIKFALLDHEIGRKIFPDVKQLIQNGVVQERILTNGWSAFHYRYPEATAVTHISRVGSNTAATQAMVFLHRDTGPLLLERYDILLDHRNGAWTVTQKEKF